MIRASFLEVACKDGTVSARVGHQLNSVDVLLLKPGRWTAYSCTSGSEFTLGVPGMCGVHGSSRHTTMVFCV
jgi:hypothetical protein